MKTALIVFRKELLDTVRDRRTIVAMVVVPLLLFPLLFTIMGSVMSAQEKKEEEKRLAVALVDRGNAQAFGQALGELEGFDLRLDLSSASDEELQELLRQEELDGAYVFDQDFDVQVEALKAGRVRLYYKSTEGDDSIARRRLLEPLEDFEQRLLTQRFQRLELDQAIVEAVDAQESNVASSQEIVGTLLGGVLPYFFVIFCFTGCMQPAIDLGAGEKERGTLETLLASPAGRLQILAGKFGVIVLTGLLAAMVSMLGLYVGFRRAGQLPEKVSEGVQRILGLESILMIFSLLVPLTVFLGGVMLSLSLFAKSFKEAQSTISPLMVVVIVPAFVGMLPGVELSATTALIPILNVSLAAKNIMSGEMSTWLLAETYASLAVLAIASLAFTARWFDRESVIFR